MHVSRLLPPPAGIEPLFTTHNPITSPGSGRQESMFFEYFASLDSILSGGPPVMRARGAAGGRSPNSVPGVLLAHIRRALWDANAIGSADEPAPNANPLTGLEIVTAINEAHPELRAEYTSQLGSGGSLGFCLQRMAEVYDPAIIARRPTMRPTGRGGRRPNEHWLIVNPGDEEPPLPPAPRRYPRVDELGDLARDLRERFDMTEVGREDDAATTMCPICNYPLVEDAEDDEPDTSAAAGHVLTAAEARRMWRLHPGRTSGEAAHVMCSDCWPTMLAHADIDGDLDRMHCPVCISRNLMPLGRLINVWRARQRQAVAPQPAAVDTGGAGIGLAQGPQAPGNGDGAQGAFDQYAPQYLEPPTPISEQTVEAVRQNFATTVQPTVTFSFMYATSSA